MIEFHPGDVFLTLLIGLGPLKAMLVYMRLTRGMERAAKRRVAFIAAGTAGIVAVGLLVLGRTAQALLHFSDAALAMAGGAVLFLLGLKMVLGSGGTSHDIPAPDASMVAIFPLALPLTLNPVGIVALITYSSTMTWGEGAITVGLIAAVVAIDVVVFLLAGRIRELAPPIATVLEMIFGILLCALAVELVIVGLEDLGIAN